MSLTSTNKCEHEHERKGIEYEREGLTWWKREIYICKSCGSIERMVIKSGAGVMRPAWYKGDD